MLNRYIIWVWYIHIYIYAYINIYIYAYIYLYHYINNIYNDINITYPYNQNEATCPNSHWKPWNSCFALAWGHNSLGLPIVSLARSHRMSEFLWLKINHRLCGFTSPVVKLRVDVAKPFKVFFLVLVYDWYTFAPFRHNGLILKYANKLVGELTWRVSRRFVVVSSNIYHHIKSIQQTWGT